MLGSAHAYITCPSWRGAQLKHRDKFSFTIISYSAVFVPGSSFWLATFNHCHRLSRIRPLGVFRFRILFSETYESIGQLVGLLVRMVS
jgi:hypothetical protein